ncbi:MAG: hypothetical protein R3F20_13375 [Planctomycetota bacterium]
MKKMIWLGAFAALLLTARGAVAQEDDAQKPKPTVEFAASWEDALDEAKALGVPIVVHSHGFY